MRIKRSSVILYWLPATTLGVATIIVPFAYVFGLSFHHMILHDPQNVYFTLTENYRRIFQDPVVPQVLKQTLEFVLASVLCQFLIGLAFALVLNQEFRGRGVCRAVTLSPWALSGVVVGIMWMLLLHSHIGVLNDILMRSGLVSKRIGILDSAETAMWGVVVANVWRGIPFFTIMLLAALQSIPRELYEAAAIDGAGRVQMFRHVVLAFLRPMITVSILLRLIWTFSQVDIIWVMTEGGPAFSTHTITSYIFITAYKFLDFGYGSALSVALFVVLLAMTVFYFQGTRLESAAPQ